MSTVVSIVLGVIIDSCTVPCVSQIIHNPQSHVRALMISAGGLYY